MAPINADVAEVEAQLSAIRLRRNALTAQRALASALSAALLAASLVILSALRGNAALFALAITLAVIGTLAGVAFAAWRARQEWLSLPATAQLADAHAALDERLTTLLAVAALAPPPVLRPLLLDQVIGCRQRWGLDALAPQRLSRWLALVPLSLLIFAATAFYARPPAVVDARHASAKPLAASARSLAGAAVVERTAQEDGLFAKGGSNTTLVTGSRDGATKAVPAGDRGSNSGSDSTGDDGAAPSGATQGDNVSERPADSKLDNLRQSIREAFGAPPEQAANQSNAGDGQRKGDGGPGKSDSAGADHNAPQPDSTSSAAGHAGSSDHTDTSSQSATSATPGADASTAAQGPRGSGRGGAGSAGATGVLGAHGSPRMQADESAPMAIKLGAISGVSPSQSEPQRRAEGVPATATNASRNNGPLPDLANEQLADVTMQQLDVGPEHEAIVRRLFTRE